MYFTTNYFFSFFLIYIIAITCKKILKDPLSSFNIYCYEGINVFDILLINLLVLLFVTKLFI